MPKSTRKDASVSRRAFLRKGATAGVGATALAGLGGRTQEAEAQNFWDMSADLVTIGAGTAGLAAAVSALDHGASVIMVEENTDIGGHGLCSGGNVHLGGGTSNQKKHGVEDSADQVFIDWIRHDHMQSRYSDRDLVRAFADENAATYEFLIENGVKFQDHLVGPTQASRVRRQQRTIQWPVASERVTHHPTRVGSGLVRALEKSARAQGAEVLLRHKMTSIVRESPSSGRVLGITATHDGRTVNIRANKGVLVATGGSTSNVTLRRTFDPRLTEEYQVAGEPWSRQSGDGELAAMAVGASLWGTANQTCEQGIAISKTRHIGCQWGYSSLIWQTDSRIFDLARASGLTVIDWQDLILVNQTGRRFWNEVDARYDFFAAAMAWSGDENKLNGGGPIWAIFDQDAVEREEWDPRPPNVDPDYFFQADTLAELAAAIKNPYQTLSMSGATLEETVARYNSFVDLGEDEDFDKPTPRYKIERPPFYAAWSTPILHDSLTGLRTNTKAQVIDMRGQVIPGLYCAGESQGGFAQHGLGRCLVFGRIAGRDAAVNGGIA
ncbi:MAG: FAD-dependent oxidoreductase [Acidobacteria bacterium]|nr:FAD-dependent oxidoreductase [Acidobacteriota bacterium]MYK87369.1 FAD-dependent oxidoreductase [Acidobacteriota bacterium]